ncbi:MAG: alpha/beta hydrolase [bacterium]
MPPQSRPPSHLDIIGVQNSTRAPVLFLHGLFVGAWVFDDIRPLVALRGHPAAALSFRGHPPLAPSNELGTFSIADYCDDAADAARVLNRPIVIGHSLGGLVALMLASRGLVRAAVLVSPAPPRGISVMSPAILTRMVSYLAALLFSRPFLPSDAHLDALVLNRVAVDGRPALRARFVADSGRAAREAALGVIKVPAPSIRVPMLVIGAEHDHFIPLSVANRVARKYSVPLHVARGHGHFLFAEPGWQHEAAVILDWIDGLPEEIRCASVDDDAAPSPTNSPTG